MKMSIIFCAYILMLFHPAQSEASLAGICNTPWPPQGVSCPAGCHWACPDGAWSCYTVTGADCPAAPSPTPAASPSLGSLSCGGSGVICDQAIAAQTCYNLTFPDCCGNLGACKGTMNCGASANSSPGTSPSPGASPSPSLTCGAADMLACGAGTNPGNCFAVYPVTTASACPGSPPGKPAYILGGGGKTSVPAASGTGVCCCYEQSLYGGVGPANCP